MASFASLTPADLIKLKPVLTSKKRMLLANGLVIGAALWINRHPILVVVVIATITYPLYQYLRLQREIKAGQKKVFAGKITGKRLQKATKNEDEKYLISLEEEEFEVSREQYDQLVIGAEAMLSQLPVNKTVIDVAVATSAFSAAAIRKTVPLEHSEQQWLGEKAKTSLLRNVLFALLSTAAAFGIAGAVAQGRLAELYLYAIAAGVFLLWLPGLLQRWQTWQREQQQGEKTVVLASVQDRFISNKHMHKTIDFSPVDRCYITVDHQYIEIQKKEYEQLQAQQQLCIHRAAVSSVLLKVETEEGRVIFDALQSKQK